MSIKERVLAHLSSPFTKHFLMVLNLGVFFAISFLSLSLDTRYPFNLVNIALVGFFVVTTIAYLIITRTKPRVSVFLFCGVGLLIWILLSYAANGFGAFPQTPILMVILSIVMYLWLSTNRKHSPFYLLAFLFASWCFLAFFVATNFSAVIHPNLSNRIGSSLGNENDVARHLVFALLINVYHLYVFKKKALKAVFAISSLTCLYLLLLTGSMSNLLLASACVVIFVFVVAKKKQRIWAGIGVGVAVVALAILVFALPALSSIKERILSIINAIFGFGSQHVDTSTIGRFRGAQYGFKLLFESPLFGNGFNSVVANYKIMAHNNLAEIGADFGLPALILEEVLILYPLFSRKKAAKKDIVFVLVIGFYIFAVQFVLVTFNSKIEAMLIPLLYAVKGEHSNFIRLWRFNQGYLPYYRARIK